MLKRIYSRLKIPLWSILLSGLFLLPAFDRFSLLEFVGVWSIWFLFFFLIIYHNFSTEIGKILTSVAILPVSFFAPYVGLSIVSDEGSVGLLIFSGIFCMLITGASVHETWKAITHS